MNRRAVVGFFILSIVTFIISCNKADTPQGPEPIPDSEGWNLLGSISDQNLCKSEHGIWAVSTCVPGGPSQVKATTLADGGGSVKTSREYTDIDIAGVSLDVIASMPRLSDGTSKFTITFTLNTNTRNNTSFKVHIPLFQSKESYSVEELSTEFDIFPYYSSTCRSSSGASSENSADACESGKVENLVGTVTISELESIDEAAWNTLSKGCVVSAIVGYVKGHAALKGTFDRYGSATYTNDEDKPAPIPFDVDINTNFSAPISFANCIID